jgi:epsilon-lactone hydrolase
MSHPGVEIISAFLSESGLVSGTIAEQREAMAKAVGPQPPPDGVSCEPTILGGRAAERLAPEVGDEGGAILYLHGGAYCTGSLDTHRGLAGRIALAAACPVFTLEYRLAPEHPHPAALTDALAAYRDLLALGTRPGRCAIAGDSAGGGLTMATLVALRDEGSPLPAAAVCLSPWTDLTQTAPSYDHMGPSDPMITRAGLDLMAEAYRADAPATSPLISPLFADLHSLPPVMIEVGEREALLDDSTRLADRIRQAGGTALLTVWPQLIHVFQAFPAEVIPEADRSIAAVGTFLSEHLSPGGTTATRGG